MGVLNVTPDSFSDGGRYSDVESAVARAGEMIAEGADILDIGGESTRPATFSDRDPLDPAEELRRILPVIARIRSLHPAVAISVDTYKAHVAGHALAAGADIINDISGLTYDPEMAPLAARSGVPLILMHLLGEPRNIPLKPQYDDVVADVLSFWKRQADVALAAGVAAENIVVDPGIGFGKNAQHSLELLRRMPELRSLGYPVLSGPSRKRFLGRITGVDDPRDRVEATAAAIALSVAGGADIVRVHDIRAMVRVVQVADAIVRGWMDSPEA
jgi:dihydropteroate synthase